MQSLRRQPGWCAIAHGRPRLRASREAVQRLSRRRDILVRLHPPRAGYIHVSTLAHCAHRCPLPTVLTSHTRLAQNALAVKFGHRIVYLASVSLVSSLCRRHDPGRTSSHVPVFRKMFISCIWCALSPNLASIRASRLFQGFGMSALQRHVPLSAPSLLCRVVQLTPTLASWPRHWSRSTG